MPHAKRHHYLPESYLARFTRERSRQGRFWVYDIKQRQLRAQTPHNTAVQGYYNAVELEDGTRSFEVEEWLSKVEGDVAPIIDQIEDHQPVSIEDQAVVAVFVALQKLRGPAFEEAVGKMNEAVMKKVTQLCFANAQRAREVMEEYERDTGTPLGGTPEEMVDFAQRDAYQIETHRNESLRLMVELCTDTAKRFVRFDWAFVHVPDGRSFVTTDLPFHVIEPPGWERKFGIRGFGYGTPGTRKIIPLSDKVCLIMYGPGRRCEHRGISVEGVRSLNQRLAADAYRLVIGRDEDLVKSLVRVLQKAELRHGFEWGGTNLNVG